MKFGFGDTNSVIEISWVDLEASTRSLYTVESSSVPLFLDYISAPLDGRGATPLS